MTTLSDHIREEHTHIRPHVDALLTTAHSVGEVPREILVEMVREDLAFLMNELVPHAEQEDLAIYQAVENAVGAKGSTSSMKREHVGIKKYIEDLSQIQGTLISHHEITDSTVRELRQVLYGLHAILSLHLTVEEEVFVPLLDTLTDEQQQYFLAMSIHT